MLHEKFQDHRTSGSREEYLKRFDNICAWRSSWSYDQDHFYKFMCPLPKEAPHKIWL